MAKLFRRVPWWICVLAASFAAYFVLQTYYFLLGPEGFGFSIEFGRERRVVTAVAPGSPADRAGVKAGDSLIALNGRSIRSTADLMLIRRNLEIGRTETLEIERQGRRLVLSAVMGRIKPFADSDYYVVLAWQVAELFLLGCALLIAFSRPRDRLARWGALAMATLSAGLWFSNYPPGFAAAWRELPRVIGPWLWIPAICVYLFGPILLTFFLQFPRPLFRARWPWAVVWLPALVFAPANAYTTFLTVYDPERGLGRLPDLRLFQWQGALLGLYGLASLAALIVNYVRLKDPNDKRRLRVLLVGGGAAVLPSLIRMVVSGAFPRSALQGFLVSKAPDIFIVLIFILFPVTFAYSILRHRLFDIKVMIRRGLQYTLARRTLISVVPAAAIILAVDLTVNRRLPLADILKARGWIYAGLGGLALVSYWQRKSLMEKLDKRFFREQYNAQQILGSVLEDIREAKSFERVSPRIAARIEAALHPEFVSVMMHPPEEPQYRALSSVPSGQTTPPLAADNKVVALARVLGRPLELLMAGTAWLEERLPREEIDVVRRARIDLLVPIGGSPGAPEGMLALGIKKSEEPYSREDQELLRGIASSLALLFERSARLEAAPTEGFEECPSCGVCYDAGAGTCVADGVGLSVVHLPRTLAGRYRLDRLRGRGGMGSVYEATDGALERRVAVKVIREDLIGSAEAAQRFRREAKAAAGFAHANVVTVHDYGLAADRHAFLVMELLEGLTLRDELKRSGRFDPSRALRIFRGICAAVDAAHRRQIVHRDLKPENIFLARSLGLEGEGETVKILDFGIAKALVAPHDEVSKTLTGFETSAGALVGTMAYLPPEQWLGDPPDLGWDLWAVSVIAYETLTGAHPFMGAPGGEWRRAVIEGRFTPVRQSLESAPALWQNFFLSCFSRNRTERPRSASEFLIGLERALAAR